MANGYRIRAGKEFETIPKALALVDSEIASEKQDAIEAQMRPTIQRVQSSALRIPTHGLKHTGLRARLAAGVGTLVTPGYIRIITTARRGEEALPRGMDSGEKGWRHPVYAQFRARVLASGNKSKSMKANRAAWTWVHQRGFSWFREPIADQQPEYEQQIAAMLEKKAQKVKSAGKL